MTLKGHTDSVHSVAFSPDGQTIASGSEDETIKLWNVQTGKNVRTFAKRTGYGFCLAFSPNGKLLASGSEGHKIKLWNIEGVVVQRKLTTDKQENDSGRNGGKSVR